VRYVAIPRASTPGAARRELEHRRPSARRSNGAPDARAGSTTSNAATARTAPNSPESTAPAPGAHTPSSPTTWSRLETWQHEQPVRHPTRTRVADPPIAVHLTAQRPLSRPKVFQVEVFSTGCRGNGGWPTDPVSVLSL
jgi:hypothetical protein